MTQPPATADMLVLDEKTLCRVFRRRRAEIRAWLVEGYLPARWLPDGRPVVLRDELLHRTLRSSTRVSGAQEYGNGSQTWWAPWSLTPRRVV
jgi:hypothetical protein